MQLRAWVVWMAGAAALALSTVAVAQEQTVTSADTTGAVAQAKTVTFSDITDAVRSKFFNADTTAPDPSTPIRCLLAFIRVLTRRPGPITRLRPHRRVFPSERDGYD